MEQLSMDHLIERYQEVHFYASRQVANLVEQKFAGENITHEQYVVLCFLQKNGPCLTSQVSDYCNVNRSATTAMINRLVNKGFVKRILDEKDRRIVLLTTTEKGSDVIAIGDQSIYHLIRSLLIHFQPEEIEQFVKTYEKIADLIKQQGKEE